MHGLHSAVLASLADATTTLRLRVKQPLLSWCLALYRIASSGKLELGIQGWVHIFSNEGHRKRAS